MIVKNEMVKNRNSVPSIVKGCFAAVIMLAIIWAIFPIRFETNDDSGIMYIIAGYNSGEIEVDSIFSGVIWGWLVGGAYKILPTVPWYTVLLMFVIWISHAVVLSNLFKYRVSKCRLVLFFLAYIGIALYSAVLLQFTTTALWPGIAACVLTWNLFDDGNKNWRQVVLLIPLVIICWSIRRSGGIAIMAFLLICFLVNGLDHIRDQVHLKKLLMVFILVVLSVCFAGGSTVIYEKGEDWQTYRQFHAERAAYTDYDSASYDEAVGVYTEIGWGENLYHLVQEWFFLDESVNEDNFHILNQYQENVGEESSIKEKAYGAILVFTGLLKNCYPLTYVLLGELIFFALMLAYSAISKGDKQLLLSVVLIFGCAVLMLIYLSIEGRLLLRVFQVCVLPAIVLLALLFVKDGCEIEKNNFASRTLMIIFLIIALVNGVYTYRYAADININNGINIRMAAEKYAIDHSENLYIYDYSMAFGSSPFITYPSKKPTNYIFWGGSTMFSPVYQRKLLNEGRTELYADAFLEDDVFFVTAEELDNETPIVKYMREKFGNVEFKQVDALDGCRIYKFSE